MRRAAISVPANIVEGMGRQGKREAKNFVNIALGSLAEVEYLLEFCLRLGYVSKDNFEKLEDLRKQVGALLWRFYRSL